MIPPRTIPTTRTGSVSAAVPWLLAAGAFVPYAVSLCFAAVGLGDPPEPSGAWLGPSLLSGWLLLFAVAIAAAWATRDHATAVGVTLVCGILTLFGLFVAL